MLQENNPYNLNLHQSAENLYNSHDYLYPNNNSIFKDHFNNHPFNNSIHKNNGDQFPNSDAQPFNKFTNTIPQETASFYPNNLLLVNPDGQIHNYPNLTFGIANPIPATSLHSNTGVNGNVKVPIVLTSIVTSTIRMPPIVVTSIPLPRTYTKHEKPLTTTLPPLILKIPTTVTKTTNPETILKTLPPQIIYQPPVTSTVHYRIDHPASTIILSTILPQIVKTVFLPGSTATLAIPQVSLTNSPALMYAPHTVVIDKYSAQSNVLDPNSSSSPMNNELYKLLNRIPPQSLHPTAIGKNNFANNLIDNNNVNKNCLCTSGVSTSGNELGTSEFSGNVQGCPPCNSENLKSNLEQTGNPYNNANSYQKPLQQPTNSDLNLENKCKEDNIECESDIAQLTNFPENEKDFMNLLKKRGYDYDALSKTQVTDEDNEKDCSENSNTFVDLLNANRKMRPKLVYTSDFISGRV
ncbi:hypothetical protein GINT2_001120 [Glugoides intestinalis]